MENDTHDPIVVAPSCTPFAADDSVDYAAVERNVERWLETPLSGFVLNTENGEEAFLSEVERLEIVRTVRNVCGRRKLVVGGVDSPSVTETLRIAERLVDAGAELLRVRIPRLTSNVAGYFQQVIPRAAAPVIVIHQMAPGMFLSHPAALGAPAEWIGEWIAMDNAYGYIASADMRFEARVRTFLPPEKPFWTCNGSLLLAGAALGAGGACLMLANVAPGDCQAIIKLVHEGKLAEAQQIQTRVLETDFQILSRGASGLKAAMELLGYDAGAPRFPAVPCDDAAVEAIRQAMQDAGLL